MECHYAVTVKKNSKGHANEQYYVDWCYFSYKKGLRIVYKTYEYDDKGRLHMHGVGIGPINLYCKKFCTTGIHINIQKLDTINDMLHWMIYIHKDMKETYDHEMEIMEEFIDYKDIDEPAEVGPPCQRSQSDECDSESDSDVGANASASN